MTDTPSNCQHEFITAPQVADEKVCHKCGMPSIPGTVENWENRKLGADERFVRVHDTPSRTPRTDALHAKLLRISEGPEWIAGRDYVEMRKHSEELESELTALRAEAEGLREKLEVIREENAELADQLNDVRAERETAERELKVALAAMAKVRGSLSALRMSASQHMTRADDCGALAREVAIALNSILPAPSLAEGERIVRERDELSKANVGLAQESHTLRSLLTTLVDAVDGTDNLDEMDGEEYQAASKTLNEAMDAARPHTEQSIVQGAIDAQRGG